MGRAIGPSYCCAYASDLDLADVKGLWAFAAWANFKLNSLPLIETAVTLTLDIGIVNEDILFVGNGNKPVSLFSIEELHSAVRHINFRFLS